MATSADPIHNIRGTAPGWWVERDGRILVAMPGPPGEMQHMWQKEILPRLRQCSTGGIIFSKTFKTFGLSEAAVGELVSPLLSSANPTLAVYAKADGVHLRLTAKTGSQKQAEKMIVDSEVSIRAILGEYIWGTDNETLEAIIGHLLVEKGLSLAVMESCTGGLLATTITDVPGSSAYFKGGLVAYSNGVKIAHGVDAKIISKYGAISPEVAQAMAEAAKMRLGADVGVSVTGVAEAEEMEAESTGMVYIGIDNGKSRRVIKGNYPGSRTQVKRRATTAALFELRKTLADLA
ncbi:putative competence-damage inducible protein [subsurface metagenome]